MGIFAKTGLTTFRMRLCNLLLPTGNHKIDIFLLSNKNLKLTFNTFQYNSIVVLSLDFCFP